MSDDRWKKYTRKYTRKFWIDQWDHSWEITGWRGGIHVHIRPYKSSGGLIEHSAGLEVHYAFPPESMKDRAPDHQRCWLIERPCWHDGTSLFAQEQLVPLFLADAHDSIFSEMFRWAETHLEEERIND